VPDANADPHAARRLTLCGSWPPAAAIAKRQGRSRLQIAGWSRASQSSCPPCTLAEQSVGDHIPPHCAPAPTVGASFRSFRMQKAARRRPVLRDQGERSYMRLHPADHPLARSVSRATPIWRSMFRRAEGGEPRVGSRAPGRDISSPSSRFPAPWSVRELEQAFVVSDANGQALAYVYFRKDDNEARHANALHVRCREVGRGEYREAALSWRRVGLGDCETNSCRCFDTCVIAPAHAVSIACTTAVGFAACTDWIASGGVAAGSIATSARTSRSAISQ
jgi:hypothetical protein